MQSIAKQCKAMQSNAKQCEAMQSNAKHCKAMQSNANHHHALPPSPSLHPTSLSPEGWCYRYRSLPDKLFRKTQNTKRALLHRPEDGGPAAHGHALVDGGHGAREEKAVGGRISFRKNLSEEKEGLKNKAFFVFLEPKKINYFMKGPYRGGSRPPGPPAPSGT